MGVSRKFSKICIKRLVFQKFSRQKSGPPNREGRFAVSSYFMPAVIIAIL